MVTDCFHGYCICGVLLILVFKTAHVLSVPDGCPAHLGRDQFLKSHGDRCYQFVLNRQLTWSGAERDCVLRGGHLASIRGLGEELFLISSLRSLNLAGRGVWIGLNDRDKEGKFVWTSGDYVDFTYWAPGQANEPLRRRSSNDISIKHQPIRVNAQDVQPNSFARRFLFSSHGSETHLLPGLTDGSAEDCVLLKYSDSGHWHDYPCEKLDLLGLVPERFPYVCQYRKHLSTKARTVMTTPTTTQTTKPITNTQVVISTMTLHPPTKGIITGSQRVPTSTKAPYSTLTTTLVTANKSQKVEISTSEPQSTLSKTKRTTTSSQKVITSTRTQQSTVTTTLPTTLLTTKGTATGSPKIVTSTRVPQTSMTTSISTTSLKTGGTATSSTKVVTSTRVPQSTVTTPTPTTLLITKGTATSYSKIVTSTSAPHSTVTMPTRTTSLKTEGTANSFTKIVTSTMVQKSTATTPTPTTLLKTKGTATSSTKVVSSTRAPQSTVTTPTPTTFSTTKLPKPTSPPSQTGSSSISNKTTATTIEIDNKGGNIASTVTKEQLRGGTETTGTKTSLLSTTWKPIGIIIG